jgi:hypothetical protein
LAEALALNFQELLHLLKGVGSLGLLRLGRNHAGGFLDNLLSEKCTLYVGGNARRHILVLRLNRVLSALLLPEDLAAFLASLSGIAANAVALLKAHSMCASLELGKRVVSAESSDKLLEDECECSDQSREQECADAKAPFDMATLSMVTSTTTTSAMATLLTAIASSLVLTTFTAAPILFWLIILEVVSKVPVLLAALQTLQMATTMALVNRCLRDVSKLDILLSSLKELLLALRLVLIRLRLVKFRLIRVRFGAVRVGLILGSSVTMLRVR